MYITGMISGSNFVSFPTTSGGFQTKFITNASEPSSAFVSELNATGNALIYSTFLGSGMYTGGADIAVDRNGNAYITGSTASASFPTTSNAYQTVFGGGNVSAFVSELNTTGSALVYSTYLGGSNHDAGYGIAVDTSGNVYVTGASVGGFPTTIGAYQSSFHGYDNSRFISKLSLPLTATTGRSG